MEANKTKNLNIRTSPEEYHSIKQFATLRGESMSGFILGLVHEYIENWEDIRDYKEALDRDEPTYSMEEVGKELGLL
jgi:uncharacterized protein (DUF1778 family)